jgi:hypothetical protein
MKRAYDCNCKGTFSVFKNISFLLRCAVQARRRDPHHLLQHSFENCIIKKRLCHAYIGRFLICKCCAWVIQSLVATESQPTFLLL